MEDKQRELGEEEDEEEHAKLEIWKYVYGFIEIAVVKCAIELGIADAIESHGSPMTLLELSSALRCDPSPLYRIMRVLVHLKIFKEKPTTQLGPKVYAQTPLSKLLLKSGENSMAALILLESSPVMLATWHGLSARIQGITNSAFESVHGEDVWSHAAANPDHSKLFNEAMACDARVAVPAVIESCLEVFKGIETIVDVGGGDGTTLRLLVEACPWIQGINFDLPHVVSVAQECDRIENVGGDMFDCVPKADAVIMKSVLHGCGDDECIRILKKCREAIPDHKGKVIIIEVVIDEKDEKEDIKLTNVRLMLDTVMMAHTNTGKERTLKEWGYVLGEAGFSQHTITPIHAVYSVIQAFP
ncbi:PREDICTED: 3'-hydroxy-N-methyl-(S)-coclaurine 4'-O-methyltransferase 2-like isoform X2 [Prunus mume]|uniref:3'-hydroxy-N-methyl-(S)-coclaurine 4'-O-methyltransferase 2-like isoform X1 n=1 Tax=Prunus mume TaxID=102107 RepID=A0ABM0P912_PRUMU|nr:PREDICTED: 3'-hydroxy-N-methyl-(S)-coclaurine 4'-O-methyltransferase 2-like isoform X1 [Prunus mume]XP_008236090.1 PREDICTED: 3'-hydroxy-N-methyl-(S)-coclaurine 4'-O-methyltransferase 2-like isoform X2 [Prunus mume]